MDKLKKLDLFPKVNDDFYQRTASGGVITIGSSLIMAALFFSELGYHLTTRTVNRLSVDTSRGEQLQINFDMSFYGLPCEWLSLDAMDISGEMHLDVDHDVYKRRLDSSGKVINPEGEKHEVGPQQDPELESKHNGTYCGSCYGAGSEGECCSSCEEVRSAYRKKGWAFTDPQGIEQCAKEGYVQKLRDQAGEGCHLWGSISVNKVAGNFHFAPGRSFQAGGVHVHDLIPFGTEEFDISHTIHKLSFGEDYPGRENPLNGVIVPKVNAHNREGKTGAYQYFLKVVPTIYSNLRNDTISTNQYSVTEHFKESNIPMQHNLPGVFFYYDLSPIKVAFSEERSSFLSFLTSVCAIVGGVFTVSGILDSFVFHGSQVIRKKKVDLGKFS